MYFLGYGSITSATSGGTSITDVTFAADTDINGTGDISFGTGGADRLRISNDGNVGIGTATPAAKLEVAGEVKFGNTSSTCNSSSEGQQRYNSTTKNMEFCNGTAWTAYGAAGATGRTSCPSGFTLIGTSGSAEAFCISTNEETSANWLNAVTACYNKSTTARLCSAGEWAMACVSGLPTGMTGNSEWVADLSGASGQLVGGASCGSFGIASVSHSYGSRCCFR